GGGFAPPAVGVVDRGGGAGRAGVGAALGGRRGGGAAGRGDRGSGDAGAPGGRAARLRGLRDPIRRGGLGLPAAARGPAAGAVRRAGAAAPPPRPRLGGGGAPPLPGLRAPPGEA